MRTIIADIAAKQINNPSDISDFFDFCDRTDTDIYEIGMETIKPFLP